MRCLHVVRMVVSPSSSHSFGILVVRHNVVVVGEFFVAYGTLAVLLDDFALKQFPHFCRRSQLSITSRVMWIFDTLYAGSYRPWLGDEFAATTRSGLVNRTEFVGTESHDSSSRNVSF